MKRTKVYVAGPISKGNQFHNVAAAIDKGDMLMSLGYIPYVPHLTVLWDLLKIRDYEFWFPMDLTWLEAADVVYRMKGESKGADREVAHAESKGIPVVHSIGELKKRFPVWRLETQTFLIDRRNREVRWPDEFEVIEGVVAE